MNDPPPHVLPRRAHRRWPWVALLITLAIGFAVHAGLSSLDKSPTYDEPTHALSSWLIVNEGDFRVNPEHPALWKYVAGLPLLGQPLTVDLNSPRALEIFRVLERQWLFVIDTLYVANPVPADAQALMRRSRMMMCLFPLALALVVARWAWAWGGPVAAVLATLLLTLDPNFLGHGGLVTNDVAATLVLVLAGYLTWRLGLRFDLRTAAALALVCAAGIGTKFTCLLLGPMIGLPLLYRALDRSMPWRAGRRERLLGAISARLGAVLGFSVITAIAALLLLWPLYQFRGAPTREGLRFDDGYPRFLLGMNKMTARAQDADVPPLNDVELVRSMMDESTGPVNELFFQLAERHLVPQAWGYGLNYANARSVARSSFLMGEYSDSGFFTYFPLAMLFKTPTAMLVVLLVCAIGGGALAVRRVDDGAVRWKLVCLIAPPTIYFAVACAANLNIGLRHVLPVYPPMFVAAGVLMARALRSWSPARVLVPLAIVGLAVETLAAFPNYIAFFNAPVGGTRGGLDLLGDSNLDWGQDLPALARWQKEWRREHPDEPFYLSYFGTVPPATYGIDYINGFPGWEFDPRPPTRNLVGGVYAISATHLQAIYAPQLRTEMLSLRNSRPLAVINGTIYIYAMAPAPTSQPAQQPARE